MPNHGQLACPNTIRTATLGWPSNNTLRADQTLFHAFRRISVVFRIGCSVFLGSGFRGSIGWFFQDSVFLGSGFRGFALSFALYAFSLIRQRCNAFSPSHNLFGEALKSFDFRVFRRFFWFSTSPDLLSPHVTGNTFIPCQKDAVRPFAPVNRRSPLP
jgi:hypothetical protein